MDCIQKKQPSSPVEDNTSPALKTYAICYSRTVDLSPAEVKIRQNIELLGRSEVPSLWLGERESTVVERESKCELLYDNKIYKNYRELVTNGFGMWALVDNSWTKELFVELKELNIKKCLEVGAGRGWFGKSISNHLDIICTDIEPYNPVFDVEELDAISAIKKYGEDTDALVISWPRPTASDFIDAWEIDKWVVYIGEDSLGCNADMDFFRKFKFIKAIEIPTWDGLNDVCLIGKKIEISDDFDERGIIKKSLKHKLPEKIANYW